MPMPMPIPTLTPIAGESMHLARKFHRPFLSGFTLIELMVTLTVVIILSALAGPSFNNLIRQLRLSQASSELHAAINFTRSEAIRRNGLVDLVAIQGDWKNGWIISSAENRQIMTHPRLHRDVNINAKFTDGLQHIAYNGNGRSRGKSSTASQSGHIYLSLGDHARLITVNFLGRARSCNPAHDKSCAVNLDD